MLSPAPTSVGSYPRRRRPQICPVQFPVHLRLVSVVGILLLAVCSSGDRVQNSVGETLVYSQGRHLQVVSSPDDVDVIDGAVNITVAETNTAKSVEYYHCQSPDPPAASNTRRFDIVLLHGSSLTREQWKQKGLMQALCANSAVKGDPKSIPASDNVLLPGLVTVTALDLGVSADHGQLRDVLKGLAQQGLVKLPVATVVSPSASGYTVMEWIWSAHITQESGTGTTTFIDMGNHMYSWIPVASPAVLSDGTDAPLQSLRLYNIRRQVRRRSPIKVLAVNGSLDKMGIQVSQKLHEAANALVKEIPDARHVAYLNQPNAFVQAVRAFLVQENVGVPRSLS
jgi:hypothetical protein